MKIAKRWLVTKGVTRVRKWEDLNARPSRCKSFVPAWRCLEAKHVTLETKYTIAYDFRSLPPPIPRDFPRISHDDIRRYQSFLLFILEKYTDIGVFGLKWLWLCSFASSIINILSHRYAVSNASSRSPSKMGATCQNNVWLGMGKFDSHRSLKIRWAWWERDLSRTATTSSKMAFDATIRKLADYSGPWRWLFCCDWQWLHKRRSWETIWDWPSILQSASWRQE